MGEEDRCQSTPRVSVIMPTYNRAVYLREAIESVLAQTFADLELIVVDDGSTDDTDAVLAGIADSRLRCVRGEHRGVSVALNRGLRAARGELISRLDSDDVWLPEMLQTLVDVLDSSPGIGVVYAKGQAMDAAGRLLPHIHGMPPHFAGQSLQSLLYDDFTCTIVTLTRRSCFARAGEYDESLPANEDWDMALRIAVHHEFAFVDRIVGRFRWHDGNMTGPASALFRTVLETRTRPLDKFFARTDLPVEVRRMESVAYENVYLYCCQRLLHVGDFGASWREARRAFGVSQRPTKTVVRLAWFILVSEFLNRFRLGHGLANRLSIARRRWFRDR